MEAVGNREPVAVLSKAARSLYVIVILLIALLERLERQEVSSVDDIVRSSDLDANRLFKCFVNKLAQICDFKPGGTTVTAFVVLQRPGGIHYVFGSNQRRTFELNTVRTYIGDILQMLADAPRGEDGTERNRFVKELLRNILCYNLARITRYRNGLLGALEPCISICRNEGSRAYLTQSTHLERLKDVANMTTLPDIEEDEFLSLAESLISETENVLLEPTTSRFIRHRASNKAGNPQPWLELRHHGSRLLSYQRAAEVLLDAAQMWPELFVNFEVTFISSSTRAANPLKAVQPPSARDIVKSQLPKGVDLAFIALPDAIQSELDQSIKDAWARKLQPYVHAEVLVHNWLQARDHTQPFDFFNGIPYIGSSKPTCRLCDYYLSGHPSGIEVRKSHGNLYPAWRIPDQPVSAQGETTEDAQTWKENTSKLIANMLGKLRLDVERLVVRRGGIVPVRRTHDSDAVSSFAARSGLTGWQLASIAGNGSIASDSASMLSSGDAGVQAISEDNGEGADNEP